MSEDSYLDGLEAYKSKQYARAIEILRSADAEQWDAQLYLGMSYYMAGQYDAALKQFANMRDRCPEPSLRTKAQTAFAMVNSRVREIAQAKKAEDELTVEW